MLPLNDVDLKLQWFASCDQVSLGDRMYVVGGSGAASAGKSLFAFLRRSLLLVLLAVTLVSFLVPHEPRKAHEKAM